MKKDVTRRAVERAADLMGSVMAWAEHEVEFGADAVQLEPKELRRALERMPIDQAKQLLSTLSPDVLKKLRG